MVEVKQKYQSPSFWEKCERRLANYADLIWLSCLSETPAMEVLGIARKDLVG